MWVNACLGWLMSGIKGMESWRCVKEKKTVKRWTKRGKKRKCVIIAKFTLTCFSIPSFFSQASEGQSSFDS